jgi:hypothetical protein
MMDKLDWNIPFAGTAGMEMHRPGGVPRRRHRHDGDAERGGNRRSRITMFHAHCPTSLSEIDITKMFLMGTVLSDGIIRRPCDICVNDRSRRVH